MRSVVINEFSLFKGFIPGRRIVNTIDREIELYFAVCSFCSSIGLRVECGSKFVVNSNEVTEFFPEHRVELWSSVREYFVGESKSRINIVQK